MSVMLTYLQARGRPIGRKGGSDRSATRSRLITTPQARGLTPANAFSLAAAVPLEALLI
jgi:hypothetical protein